MSLLDDVSIVVTPNGYKAGELYAVIPVPTEGANVVINGDFTTDSDWSKGTGWTISGGSANCDGSQTGTTSLTPSLDNVVNNVTYIVEYTISNYTSGSISIKLGNTGYGAVRTANGTYTEEIKALATTFPRSQINANSSFTGSIDNVSVKEYTAADMDVTRATAATRVDENGLVNYAEIIGSDLTSPLNFLSTWLEASVDSKTSNTFTVGGSGRGMYFMLPENKTLKINVSGVTGSVELRYRTTTGGAGTVLGDFDTDLYLTTTNATTNIYLRATGAGTVSFTDVSVKEVTRDNVPRIDYSGCPHILAEPQRTNLVTYSEDFTQWTKSNASLINTITSTVISPDGVSYANKLYPIGSATSSYISQIIAGNCFSMFIKKGERRWVLIYGGFANSNVWFDSENGVFGNVLSQATATVESFGNDWYRIKILWSQNSTQVRIYNTDSGTSTQSTGNGTDGLYIWGAQLEAGSYATSYIPTSGSTVTRNQDIFTRDGISSLINSTSGSFFIEMAALNQPPVTQISISLSGDTSSDRILIYSGSGGGSWLVQFRKNGGNLVAMQENATITNQSKVAVSWEAGRYVMYIDGIKATNYTVGSETTSTTFDVGDLKNLQFSPNHGATSNYFYGKVKQLQVYKTALTDEQLLQLTGESGTDFYESYAEMASALTYTIQ